MLNSIKASIKDTFIFGFGNLAVKIVGLILIPLYTNPKFFSVEDFGIIGILDISGLVLIAIFASSIPQSLTRWYWSKDHRDKQTSIFFMSFVTQILFSFLFCVTLVPLAGSLSVFLFDDTSWKTAIILITVSSALQSVNNLINTLLRLQAKSFIFMLTNLLKLILVLLLTIYFIIAENMGVEGIYLAQVIGNSLAILVLLPYSLKNSTPSFDLSIWKPMMAYGFPLIVSSFSTVMLNVIDRYTLNSLALLKYVAVYTLAFKISSTLKLVLADTIKLAVFPQMIKRIDSPGNRIFYPKVMLYSSYVVMFGIIGVSLFSLEAIKILAKTPELWSAVMIVPILSLSIFFVNMREVSIYGLIVSKKTGKISLIVFISAILNLCLNLLFVPLWNATGSAVATLLSQFSYWLLLHYVAQKSYFIPYETRRMAIIFITGTLISLAGLLLNDVDLLPRFLVKILLLTSFPVILYFLNFYEPVELQTIKGFARKWANPGKLGENLRSLKDIKDDTLIE